MTDEQNVIEPEVVDSELARPETALAVRTQWTKEEVNALVATAKQFPRDMERYHKNMFQTIKEMDEKEAEAINYHAPVGNGQFADGESIRLAELVRSNFGNIMLKEDSWCDEKFAYGVCFAWDYEANNATTKKKAYPITYSRKGNRAGGRYSDNMVAKTMMKAQAVARRDAIFDLVPKVVYKKYARMALEKVVGTPEELPHKVDKYLSMLSNIGQVERQRVVEMLGFATEAEIDSEGLKKLIKTIGAITQNEISMADLFPPAVPPLAEQPGADGLSERIKTMPGTVAAEATPAPAEPQAPAAPPSTPRKPKPATVWDKKPKREFDPIICEDLKCGNVFTDDTGQLRTHIACEKMQTCPREH